MSLFFLTATPPTAIYTLSLHDALPISRNCSDCSKQTARTTTAFTTRVYCTGTPRVRIVVVRVWIINAPTSEPSRLDRKSTRLNSSHVEISYAVFCLKKKTSKSAHHRRG